MFDNAKNTILFVIFVADKMMFISRSMLTPQGYEIILVFWDGILIKTFLS